MKLRSMVDDDAIAVLALETAAARFPWSLTQYVDSLAAGDDALVFEINEAICGFVIFKSVVSEFWFPNVF